MKWRKLGRVFVPDGSLSWARSHAMAPTPVLLPDGPLRVYVTCCDADMVGRVGWVDLDPEDPTRVVEIAREPALGTGAPGCFDDNGVCATAVLPVGNGMRMYYFGYQLGTRVRYLLFAGAAQSRDGGRTFQRCSEVPILERRDGERFVRSGPFVLADPVAGFRMWYVSGDAFVEVDGKSVPHYGLRHITSPDGLSWPGAGTPVLTVTGGDEYGLGRPYVVRDGEGFRMWYSVRTRSRWYRMGEATSPDGLRWTRGDGGLAGIDVSGDGWDSSIVCYSAVLTVAGRTYMFYNGNDYGRTGFGAAYLEPG